MSISIVVHDAKAREKRLFGLLVCHHQTPHFLPYDVRETCTVISQLLSMRYSSSDQNDYYSVSNLLINRVENLLHDKLEEKRIAMKEMVNTIATTRSLPVDQVRNIYLH